MLSENFEDVCDDYYEKVTGNCQRRLDNEWSVDDENTLLSKTIVERLIELKGWFHCQFCFIPYFRCPVFKNKLQFK